ncbi:hypothetical protein [Altericista sp. CCNU0014]|uniref:hypothetical protein n=1 Tax=Altericista sp. CCNU0014 TaxID=3082949 RepID=UPI00384D02A0
MFVKSIEKYIKPIDILFFILLIALSVTITFFYVSKEQYFYYWDYSRSSEQISDLITSFEKSPFEGIGLFIISLFDDYTQLPSLPMLPFRIIFGESRLGFIYSLVLAYIVPFCLVMGTMLSKAILFNTRSVFWTASFFTLLVPPVWISVFRGFPDIGGSTLISLAILTYWQNSSLKNSRQRYWIAILFAITVLFRRHFIYSIRAFVIAVFIYKICEILLKYKSNLSRALKYITIFSIRLIYVLILFAAFAFIVILKALSINYRVLYASYETSVASNIQYYAQSFGLILLSFALTGFVLGCLSALTSRRRINFLALFSVVSIFQWIFFAKQINVQYVTHFLPFIVFGNYILIWNLFKSLFKSWSIIVLAINAFILILNSIFAFSPVIKLSSGFSSFFSKQEPPLFRKDYYTIKTLVEFLRSKTSSEKRIYVAASSYSLNYSVFTVAEQQLFGKSILPIARNANIDSRDFYPLNGLLQARYVVVAFPFQYHVDPKEQTVIKVVVDAFTQNWAIAQDFAPLPAKFKLENGSTVRIYERIRPTSFPTILDTLAAMRSQVSRVPGQEPFWLDLKSGQPSAIIKDPLVKLVQVLRLQITNRTPASLLYYGKIPKQAKVTGLLSISKCPNSSEPISLKLSTLDKDGKVLLQTIESVSNSQLTPFEIKISARNASYMKLNLMVESNNPALIFCRAELNLLNVSPQ